MRILSGGTAANANDEALLRALARQPLFAGLSADQLRKVSFFMKMVEFEASEVVVEKGARDDSFYVIHRGCVDVQVPGFLGRSKTIASLGAGDFFGELAPILKQPRTATVACAEETVCFVLDSADLELLMERNADVAAIIKTVARQRTS